MYVDEAGSEKQFAFLNLLIRFFQFKCLGLPLTEMVKQASNDEADNVHMLLDFHPKNSIAALTGSLKSSTASILEKEFPQEVQKYHWSKVSFCSNSYYIASCGGFANRSFKEIYPKSR